MGDRMMWYLLNKDFKIYNIHLPPLKSKKFGKYYNNGIKKHFIHNIPKGEDRKRKNPKRCCFVCSKMPGMKPKKFHLV